MKQEREPAFSGSKEHFDFRFCKSSRTDWVCQCSRLESSGSSAAAEADQMVGAVSQRPKDFPGATPLRKFEDVGTGLSSETQVSPAGSGRCQRQLKTDLHLAMGQASWDRDQNSLKQSGGSASLVFHILLRSLGHFLLLEFISSPDQAKPKEGQEKGWGLVLPGTHRGSPLPLCRALCRVCIHPLCSCLLTESQEGGSLRNGTINQGREPSPVELDESSCSWKIEKGGTDWEG